MIYFLCHYNSNWHAMSRKHFIGRIFIIACYDACECYDIFRVTLTEVGIFYIIHSSNRGSSYQSVLVYQLIIRMVRTDRLVCTTHTRRYATV